MLLIALSALFPMLAQNEDDVRRKGDQEPKNPLAGKPEAAEAGRLQYLTSCVGCHGPTAEGGRGPRLTNNAGVRGASDDRLYDSVKNGVRGSDMPPSPLPADKIWQMVTYIRTLNARAYESRVPGDVEAGGRLFHGKAGCVQCHRIRGEGGLLGPDLSNLGAFSSVAQIRESILKPSARPTAGHGGVSVTLRAGPRVEGIARDNTNYAIQVMDAQGRLHLLDKRDVTEVVFRKQSLMPGDYGSRLSREEQRDLIAFLSRQAIRTESKEK